MPTGAIGPVGHLATLLTVVSLAVLGLAGDVPTVARAGGRVTAAVVLSLVGMRTISLMLVVPLGIA